jgi:hypothetical protein
VILKDIRYADLKALVEFMYKGEVNVVQEQLPTLLKTAEALKIKGLAEVTGEGGSRTAEDKPHASVTPRPESPGAARRKRQRLRRKSTDSVAGGAGHSDSEESAPKASRTEHDDSSMDGATSLDDGSQASVQTPSGGQKEANTSNVQSATVNNSSSSSQANQASTNATSNANSTTNGPNSSSKDVDFEPTRLLEASMTTDHGADNSTDMNNSTGPDNALIPDGLDIKPIITLEEGATPAGSIVPASAAPSLPTGTDAISSLFPAGTGGTALPGTSYQASPQSHGTYLPVAQVGPRSRHFCAVKSHRPSCWSYSSTFLDLALGIG